MAQLASQALSKSNPTRTLAQDFILAADCYSWSQKFNFQSSTRVVHEQKTDGLTTYGVVLKLCNPARGGRGQLPEKYINRGQ